MTASDLPRRQGPPGRPVLAAFPLAAGAAAPCHGGQGPRTYRNGIGLEMVRIEAGSFVMGSDLPTPPE